MDLLIRHGSTNITSHVISYERVHNICSSIGTLQIILDGSYSATISPHDQIKITENGDFKVAYYVSDVSHNVPDGTTTLQCQDKSKYIVDYFIPTSYVVDYPSYTRYWIEKFLDEAGLTYQFNTTSQGNLLSNYTNLGLQPAYDQIMMLLQMSGWYMYFDGNGKAIIGSLTTDLSSAGSVGKTDILDIKRVTDDKMLRNRAVVWGQFDPLTQQYAFADVSVHTRDNYDHNDLRAVVISNNNIPNKNSAYGIANQLLKEFARPTVEKHLTVWGARNYNLGEMLKVDSHVWRGKGLITTFGVSMSRDGLVTNIVLDERCPRLFGFFDFGDYVYVATYGEGIWRKHIQFDPTWYNFSSGLTDLAITDMHIKDGIFGSVGAGGVPFYANSESGPWHPITITGLDSSFEDTVVSGAEIVYQSFSGIMARATIVDKDTNNVKFGVDTWSGLNLGDYFLNYSGMITSVSGVSISGGHRGWILEYDPFTGALVGGLGSGIYPISVSGNYNIRVLDLENDGHNDYVSVATSSNGIDGDASTQQYNYGYGGITDLREGSKISLSNIGNNPSVLSTGATSSSLDIYSIGMVDNVNEHEFFYIERIVPSSYFFVIKKYDTTNANFTQLTSTFVALTAGKFPIHMDAYEGRAQIIKASPNTYRFLTNSGSTVELGTITHNGAESYSQSYSTIFTDGTYGTDVQHLDSVVQNDKTAIVAVRNRDGSPEDFDKKLWYIVVDLEGGSWSSKQPVYSSGGTSLAKKYIQFRVYPYDDGFQTIGFQIEGNSNPRDIYSLSGTGIGVNKGAFIASKSVSVPMTITNAESGRLSRTWSAFSTAESGTNYINYGINGVEVLTVGSFGTGNIINSEFDNKAFRTTDIAGTHQLQVTNLPLNGGAGWTTVLLDGGIYKPKTNVFFRMDTITNYVYIYATKISSGDTYLLGLNSATYAVEMAVIISQGHTLSSPGQVRPYNIGNMIATIGPNAANQLGMEFNIFRNLTPPLGGGGGYLVLQRDGSDFHIIEQEAYPIRIDISNSSPLLTVGSGDSSFHSHYIYDTELLSIIPVGFGGNRVNDYRYTFLEPVSSGVSISGIAGIQTGLYITSSGIYGFDVSTYSGGFQPYYDIPSGAGTRIETSNYGLNGQYIFMTTSGVIQQFYQKDPQGYGFDLYSGLVQSYATIIRLDDRN